MVERKTEFLQLYSQPAVTCVFTQKAGGAFDVRHHGSIHVRFQETQEKSF